MPELPEVETVRKGLEKALKGSSIESVQLRRKNLRIPFPKDFAKMLAGRKITGISRRAKYLLFSLSGGLTLIAHLGMSGRFSVSDKAPKSFAAHDHVVFYLTDKRVVIYNDARRFGLMTLEKTKDIAANALFYHLGPEPFSDDFSTKYLKSQLVKRKAPVKVALMDQQLVVGVGNIYASEALFLAKINPKNSATDASKDAARLISSIRAVLQDAINSGGSSLRDFVHVSGEVGYFQHHFNVYGRRGKPCFCCGNPILMISQAGRSSFYCEHCQR